MTYLTEKQKHALHIIEQHFSTQAFNNQDIKAIDSTIATATVDFLKQKGILEKIGSNPSTYQLIPSDQRKDYINPYRIIELETGLIFENCIEATKQKGDGYSKIKDAVGGRRRIAGGTHWCKVSDLPSHFTTQDMQNKIMQIDDAFAFDGNKKMTRGKMVRNKTTGDLFYTAADAQKWCKCLGVEACCRGEQKTAGGYEWEYVNLINMEETND